MRASRNIVLFSLVGATAVLAACKGEAPPKKKAFDLTPTREVDVLLVVDNSAGMQRAQCEGLPALQRLIGRIAHGDVAPSGGENAPALRSVHVGVVTTDMGVLGSSDTIYGCHNVAVGDDGLLRSTVGAPGRDPGVYCAGAVETELGSCASTYPIFASVDPSAANAPEGLAQAEKQLLCLGGRAGLGCGMEQPLEAALKALTPSSASVRFFGESAGHGDKENCLETGCLVRPESALLVVLLTDEDDCSAEDVRLFRDAFTANPANPYSGTPLNLRCAMHPEALHAVARYAEGLMALRPGHPARLVYAPITGVPSDLIQNDAAVDYDAILADPRMEVARDPDARTDALRPGCMTPGVGQATPARRLVTLAKELDARGATVVAQSICTPSGVDERIATAVTGALRATCLHESLPRRSDHSVDCELLETLPAEGEITRCDQLQAAGRDAAPVRVTDGRQVCRVRQVVPDHASDPPAPPAGVEGWYYDDFSPARETECPRAPARVALTPGVQPVAGATSTLECN